MQNTIGGIQGLSNLPYGIAQTAQGVSDRELMKAQTSQQGFPGGLAGVPDWAKSPELTAAQHLEKAQHHLLCAQQIISSVK